MQFQDEEISLRDSYLLSSETDALANLAPLVKNLPARQETLVRSLGQEDPLEKGKQSTIYSSILAWRIPCTEESGGLQTKGSQVIDTT